MDEQTLQEQLEALKSQVRQLQQALAERDARIAELEEELKRRGKNYRPKPNRKAAAKKTDRRKRPHRKHGGYRREIPTPDESQIKHHDVYPDTCPDCQGQRLQPTGEFQDHLQAEIPEPQVEYHRYRRHQMQCLDCGRRCLGRGDLELPDAHIGPRARLLVGYARAYLGISLEKTCNLLDVLWGLPLSRAGALGHVLWGGKLFAPVVQQFLKLLRQSDVVHADETGWRIDGKNVWAWCFCNPQLAVFLIDKRRSSQVLIETLGESLPGVLVTDFYAAYNLIDARKQRCLTHLLRELHQLSETLPPVYVTRHLRPLIELFQTAIALAKRRDQLSPEEYDTQCNAVYERFGDSVNRDSNNADCRRIYKRLHKYADELFTFLEHRHVPPENNAAERDIRSIAAARSDGGVNRTEAGAKAFANLKSVIRTCQKNGRNFLNYGLDLIRATFHGEALPLPDDGH